MENPDRTEFVALVEAIHAGRMSRIEASQKAAEITGCSPNTFLSWVRRSGNAEKLRDTRGNAGQNSIHAHTDPVKVKAYEDAMAEAVGTHRSVRSVAAKYAVNYVYLARKVKKARAEQAEIDAAQALRDTEARAAKANDDTIRELALALARPHDLQKSP